MWQVKAALLGLVLIASTADAKQHNTAVQGTGFICTSSDGQVKRLNIDTARSRYQAEGGEPTKISTIGDVKLVLVGQNPDLMSTPMGPVFHTEEIDRRTLVLSIASAIPDKGINRRTDYQCAMGPPIDFTAGRKF